MNEADQRGTVGILPAGALGVGFFYHLSRQLEAKDRKVFFISRSTSHLGRALLEKGRLFIAKDNDVCEVPAEGVIRPPLLASAQSGWLPEFLIVCPQSDQVLSVMTEFVELLEWLHAQYGLAKAVERLPVMILSSNGIYYQRVRRYLVETLEESTLYGRLPDLWGGSMARIVGKLLRGVTMQTAQREGDGAEAIYRPGPPGLTQLAGGDRVHRQRCQQVLSTLGGNFKEAEHEAPTRAEFDKALINLFANLLGQFKAIDAQGHFHAAKVGEILPEPEDADTRKLAQHVVAVGRAVNAYRVDEDFEPIYHQAMTIVRGPLEHVPSSIKWIEAQLRAGTLKPEITPTEKWLLEPLIQYASTAGLEDSVHYFQDLMNRLQARFALAIAVAARPPAEPACVQA
jgi:hypothetical protein